MHLNGQFRTVVKGMRKFQFLQRQEHESSKREQTTSSRDQQRLQLQAGHKSRLTPVARHVERIQIKTVCIAVFFFEATHPIDFDCLAGNQARSIKPH